MAGTTAGGRKSAEKNKKKDPDHYKKIGHSGGVKHVAKGFSMLDPGTIKILGARGGKAPRRKKTDENVNQYESL